MNYYYPIFTEKTVCQDCYKCVRECPVKAIRIEDNHAEIIQERCILCGHCVAVCPMSAKKIRNDVNRAKQLLRIKKKVILSLAPSFVTEFKNISHFQLIAAFKKLGFFGVSETALGAELVSAGISEMLTEKKTKKIISSACPTIVEYLKKYEPALAGYIPDMCSPVLAHSRMLRSIYGNDIAVVFAGPCISKKLEADNNPELLDIAVTFKYLQLWFKEENIILNELPENPENDFIPYRAAEGALYPVDGGMLASIKASCKVTEKNLMNFSGIRNIKKAVKNFAEISTDENIFIELLACEGGCVNGPIGSSDNATLIKRREIFDYADLKKKEPLPAVDLFNSINTREVIETVISDDKIYEALCSVGKSDLNLELNCGGCGYNSCRDFAAALVLKKAERMMCVSYMKDLAQKKANALLKTMPSAVVIADRSLSIIECNYKFAEMMGAETMEVYNVMPGLKNADLSKIFPFTDLFEKVLLFGEDINNIELRYNKSVLSASVFSIEKNNIAGCILNDITEPAVKKDEIIKAAKNVITRNLSTVQQIAYLLGENAAESEVILNSIIDGFSLKNETE